MNNDFLKKYDIKNPLAGYFDYDLIKMYIEDTNNLVFRKYSSDDIFMPFGKEKFYTIKDYFSKKSKKIKSYKNFIEYKKDDKLENIEEYISTISGKIFLSKKNENEVFWILGDRISNKLKITDSTKKILRIEIKLVFKALKKISVFKIF